MKKVINKTTYNTDTAEFVKSRTSGNFGEDDGYEEKLYVTKRGLYFLHCIGGKNSKYPQEQIIPLSPEEISTWENAEM